ncbi:MAG: hypothetical protein WBA45_11560 [Microthrixaceae bacterium]
MGFKRTVGARIAGAAVAFGAVGFAFVPVAGAVPNDSIVATPGSGPVGSTFVVAGTLSCPEVPLGGDIMLAFVDAEAGPQTRASLGTTPYLADNAFSATVTVPSTLSQLNIGEGITEVPVTSRSYQISAQCSIAADQPNSVTGTFTVTAAPPTTTPPTTSAPTTVAPTTAPPTSAPADFTPPSEPPASAVPFSGQSSAVAAAGSSIDIDQGGFVAGEAVTVVLYSTPTVLASATADPSGILRAKVTIPAGTTAGSHTLVLFGDSTVKSLQLMVNAAADGTGGAAGNGADNGRELAFTGSDSVGAQGAVGALMVIVGLAIVFEARRRRESAT